ncbi:MAG TPA: tyrosine-type recombinase/integrase [Gemmataceae bacterium]|nr:tyrosine-type recombinase/integrase [Gemmataceae bacterium]
MARIPKPWFREDRQAWFVTINGERHNLGADEKEAKRKFHELMASDGETAAPPKSSTSLTIAEIFEKFLDWCSKHRSIGTYEWSRYRIQMFITALGEGVMMAADTLRPFHLEEWIDKHQWSANYRRGIIAAVQRAYNWSVRSGHLVANPIRFIEKPSATRREQVVTPEDWPAIRDHYKDGDPFRDLLEFAWETGCRPEEAKKIAARHLQLDKHRIVIPKQEAKGKKRPRVIFLTPRAEAIIRRRSISTGLVFLNTDGKPWTSWAMNCRFCRLQRHLGRQRMKELGIEPSKAKDSRTREKENRELQAKHGIKFAAYSLRHGFATRKLEDGIDHLTVAAWMGHADATMLARVYSHVSDRDAYLHEKLNGDSADVDVAKD